jgi:hypothetical protein
VDSFELINADGDTLFFKKVTEKGFCQVIHEGSIKVYHKFVKEIAKANYGGAYNANARTYDEFVDANVFMISKNGEPLEEIKGTRKAFEAKFPEKSEAIRRYVKENKPDLKKPKELVPFLAYLENQH